MENIEHREVLVVGAGPAGTIAAQRLAEEEIDVLAIERREIVGNPAQCGECIPNWGEVITTFRGVEDDPWLRSAFEFPDRIKLHRLDWMRVFSPSMKCWGFELDAFSAHRPQFDGMLAERALGAGAEIRVGTALRKIQKQPKLNREVYITDNGYYTADYVIDASGSLAQVGRLRRGKDPKVRPADQVPTVYAQVEGDLPETFDVFLGTIAPNGYAWVIPKGDTANVGLGVRAGTLGDTMLKQHLEEFCDKLDFEILSFGGGWIPMGGPVKRMVDGNVLATGDAAGLVMPSNGGGISQAMISAKFAADAIIGHRNHGQPLEKYEKLVRQSMGRALRNSLRSKRLGYTFLKGDFMTEAIMRVLGPIGGLKRAMECRRPLWII